MPVYRWKDPQLGAVKLYEEEIAHSGARLSLNMSGGCLARRIRQLEAESVALRSQISRLENQLSNAAGREARFGVELPVVEMELKSLREDEGFALAMNADAFKALATLKASLAEEKSDDPAWRERPVDESANLESHFRIMDQMPPKKLPDSLRRIGENFRARQNRPKPE